MVGDKKGIIIQNLFTNDGEEMERDKILAYGAHLVL